MALGREKKLAPPGTFERMKELEKAGDNGGRFFFNHYYSRETLLK